MANDELVPGQDADWRAVVHAIDTELDRLHRAVAAARRQHWRGDDVVEPELENFLARLSEPAPGEPYERVAALAPAAHRHRNSWRELIERVG